MTTEEEMMASMKEQDASDKKRIEREAIHRELVDAHSRKIADLLGVKLKTDEEAILAANEALDAGGERKKEVQQDILARFGEPGFANTAIGQFGQGLTFNMMDELQAKTAGLAPDFLMSDWEKYISDMPEEQRLEYYRAVDELQKKGYPITSLVADLAGSFVSIGKIPKVAGAVKGGVVKMAPKLQQAFNFIENLASKAPNWLKSKWVKGAATSGTMGGAYTLGASEEKELKDFFKGFGIGAAADPVFRAGTSIIAGIGLDGFLGLPASARETIRKKWKELGWLWKDKKISDQTALRNEMINAVQDTIGERSDLAKRSLDVLRKTDITEGQIPLSTSEMAMRTAGEKGKSLVGQDIPTETAIDRFVEQRAFPHSRASGESVSREELHKLKQKLQGLAEYDKRQTTQEAVLDPFYKKGSQYINFLLKESKKYGSPEYAQLQSELADKINKLGALGDIPKITDPLKQAERVSTFLKQATKNPEFKGEALAAFDPALREKLEENAINQFLKSEIGRGSTSANIGGEFGADMGRGRGPLAVAGFLRDKYGRRIGAQGLQIDAMKDALLKSIGIETPSAQGYTAERIADFAGVPLEDAADWLEKMLYSENTNQ